MHCPECSRDELDEIPSGRGTWLTCPTCGFKKFTKRQPAEGDKEAASVAQTLAVKSAQAWIREELGRGISEQALVQNLTQHNWPKGIATRLVEEVASEPQEQAARAYIYSQLHRVGLSQPAVIESLAQAGWREETAQRLVDEVASGQRREQERERASGERQASTTSRSPRATDDSSLVSSPTTQGVFLGLLGFLLLPGLVAIVFSFLLSSKSKRASRTGAAVVTMGIIWTVAGLVALGFFVSR